MKKLGVVIAIVCSVSGLGLAGSASAIGTTKTVSATVGPVPIPAVPVQVCVDNTCVDGPAATSVALSVSATAAANVNPTVVLPTITAGTCAAGTGAVLVVNTGSLGAAIQCSVTLTVNGRTQTLPISPTIATPNKTVTVSACAV